MGGQSITELNDNAFEHFPNLLAIAMAYNRYVVRTRDASINLFPKIDAYM